MNLFCVDVIWNCLFFSGGWNNNPSCREFHYIYRRLIARAGVLPSQAGNVIPQDGNDLLSQDDIDYFDLDPALDQLALSRFQSNVLTYICGWVVRKIFSLIKCAGCRKALIKVPESIDSDFLLLRLKNNGGLLYPNDDVRKIVFATEKVLKQGGTLKVEKAKITSSVLRYVDVKTLFNDESEHFIETSTIWCNHLLSLAKLIISVYTDLRLHHTAKQWNLSSADKNVRQLLTRTVIFRYQWPLFSKEANTFNYLVCALVNKKCLKNQL